MFQSLCVFFIPFYYSVSKKTIRFEWVHKREKSICVYIHSLAPMPLKSWYRCVVLSVQTRWKREKEEQQRKGKILKKTRMWRRWREKGAWTVSRNCLLFRCLCWFLLLFCMETLLLDIILTYILIFFSSFVALFALNYSKHFTVYGCELKLYYVPYFVISVFHLSFTLSRLLHRIHMA